METIAETANLRGVGALFGRMFASLRVVRVDRRLDHLIVWQVNYCYQINPISKKIFPRVQNLESPIRKRCLQHGFAPAMGHPSKAFGNKKSEGARILSVQ